MDRRGAQFRIGPQLAPRAGAVSFGHSPFQDRLRLALKQNLMGSADCEPTFGLVPGRPRHVYLQGRPQLAPRAGAVFFLGGNGKLARGRCAVGGGSISQVSGGWLSLLAPTRYPASTGFVRRSNREQRSSWGQQGAGRGACGPRAVWSDAPSRRWQQHTNRSRDPRSKQIASCLLHSVYRPRKDHSRTGLDIGCDPGRVLQSDHVRTLLMKPPPPAITASTSWLTALRA